MEKKILLKWTKGLLALVLAFLMLLGNGMDVFAAEYCMKTGCDCGRHHLRIGDIISWGDRIYLPDNSNISAEYSSYFFSMGGGAYGYVDFRHSDFPEDSKWRYDRDEMVGGTILYYRFEQYVAPEVDPAAE